jgi:hypothetical protein
MLGIAAMSDAPSRFIILSLAASRESKLILSVVAVEKFSIADSARNSGGIMRERDFASEYFAQVDEAVIVNEA